MMWKHVAANGLSLLIVLAIGLAVARSFGRSEVMFYENGVVSLNLPPLAQHVGARATRSRWR